MNDDNQPATKRDLGELKEELTQEFTQTFDTKLETVRDELVPAFQLTEESIRKNCTHADEHAALKTRVSRLERHVAIGEH